jgi:hypothetical protein
MAVVNPVSHALRTPKKSVNQSQQPWRASIVYTLPFDFGWGFA